MMLFRLFKTVSLSHLRAEKIKFLLTFSGIALGVAVYTAIRLANYNVFESFESSAELAAGPDVRVIRSKNGAVEESLIPLIRRIRGVKAMTPVDISHVEAKTGTRRLGLVQIMGTDLFAGAKFNYLKGEDEELSGSRILELLASPEKVLISRSLAGEISGGGLWITVNAEEKEIIPLARMKGGLGDTFGGRTLLMDIWRYQDLFGSYGRVQKLWFIPGPDFSEESFRKSLEEISPVLTLDDRRETARQAAKMTSAFRLNLHFLALISLFVGFLLIYNTVSYSVLKRRREMGILQCLGARPETLFRLISLESVFLGVAASCFGAAAGYVLSWFNIKLIVSSITNLYFPAAVSSVSFPFPLFLECLLLGPAVSFLGSLLPGLEVFRIAPRESLSYQNFEAKFRRVLPRLTAAGTVLLLLSLFFARRGLLEIHILMGFLSPVLLTLGMVFLMPQALFSICLLRGVFKKTGTTAAWLALDHIRMTLQRNALAAASAMTAIGMFIGVSMMILSFRGTVEHWIHHITTADLFVGTGSADGGEGGFLPNDLAAYLGKLDSVEDVDFIMSRKIPWEGRLIKIHGVRFDILEKYDRLLFKEEVKGSPPGGTYDFIYISETFSERTGIKAGDILGIPGNSGIQKLPVRNVYYDYSSDQGVILVPEGIFGELFGEERKTGAALYLRPQTDPELTAEEIISSFPSYDLTVRSNKALRKEVMNVFDQTFRITKVLQSIALIIAGFSILNTVLMLMLERSRELAVMKAIGAKASYLARLILSESLFLGAVSAAGGVLFGFFLALFLVFVLNRFFFAWSVHFDVPWVLLSQTVLGVLAVSFAAGMIPAALFFKQKETGKVRYE